MFIPLIRFYHISSEDFQFKEFPFKALLPKDLINNMLTFHTAEELNNVCDNRGATIVIIKIKGSKRIIGGYNPFSWDSSGSYENTTKRFMFSFTDRRNTNTAKVSYSAGTYSIGCYPGYGPIFDGGFSCKNDGTILGILLYFSFLS
ncbi:BTB/POZ domain-containing protein [Rhizophagus clarus]|uniref:BTB/POZ domain-containing protein n=1 Tax=Rhizophagus clarus TaxID=94130 RepID=A0A8H3QQ75_9GLOM|nr:BTB/POZ domain-containing protein [Rhizophagus clarus]